MVIKACIWDIEKNVKVEITNPEPRSPMKLSDMDFGLRIIEDWEKHTAFQLRENMEIKNL